MSHRLFNGAAVMRAMLTHSSLFIFIITLCTENINMENCSQGISWKGNYGYTNSNVCYSPNRLGNQAYRPPKKINPYKV